MAVITVSITDSLPVKTSWELPPNPVAMRSPIPRGLVTFFGTDAILAKGANDETSYKLRLTMPTGFAYLPKLLSITMQADALSNNFGLQGIMAYVMPSRGSTSEGSFGTYPVPFVCPGETIALATIARRTYAPIRGTAKQLLRGGDLVDFFLSDMDAGTSDAGDMNYYLEFYQFDVNQVDKWEVHTPIPMISHTSF